MSATYISTALRRLVIERAGGRCEYCGMPEAAVFAAHEIDHIIAEKHGGNTEADNLALSCALCNKHKGSDVASVDPDSGDILPLIHPRRERWSDHFQLQTARIEPLTPTGRVTVRLLQLNHPDRVEERELLIKTGLFTEPS
ncbi:MAG: HNH endonuclease [Acidobacteria bacterium]|nr:HNH endonuclease [Acidobacteriota bacterium]